VKSVNISPLDVNEYLKEMGTEPLSTGAKLSQLIRRPQLSYKGLAPFDKGHPKLSDEVAEQVELSIKYEGYIKIQLERIESMRRLEKKELPQDIDYSKIRGLRLEAAEKLGKIRPLNLGQASRISGVNPADISVLLIWLER
ncbi:MAG: tRNA uridine-5-carboxymethylaminomethyl(34) synthesis enzyme MnmG, partial [Ruminococcus sp.]|nr:tRNA uridine-5-carboxymethylaminomethyl(34) synthesis enzyme MnmG [Ruminococcus sp.]